MNILLNWKVFVWFKMQWCVFFKREQSITSASKDHFFLSIQDLSRMAVWVGGGTEILYNDFCSLVVFLILQDFCTSRPVTIILGIFDLTNRGHNFFWQKSWGHGFSTTCTQKLSYKALIHSIKSCRSEPNHCPLVLTYPHTLFILSNSATVPGTQAWVNSNLFITEGILSICRKKILTKSWSWGTWLHWIKIVWFTSTTLVGKWSS